MVVYFHGVQALSVGDIVSVGEPWLPGSTCGYLLVSNPYLLADELWSPYHDLARQLGVVSCWSFPVQSPATGQTLGTFALYRDHAGLPDASRPATTTRPAATARSPSSCIRIRSSAAR